MNDRKIYLSPPHLSGEELEFVKEALASNWVAPVGPMVNEFERQLSNVLATKFVVTTSSGTAAIHLALLALGVKSEDEVICSTFTFCASANPIVYCGAKPVFVDSERETWNMDPTLLQTAIQDRIQKTGNKPKAIVLVHLYGMPARLKEIISVANDFEIPIIEDAAEALGATYEGRPLGTFGKIGISSFNGNKIITTSGGGALFTDDEKIAQRVRYLREDAKEPLPYYQHNEIGYNYRFSNILAALGCAQLKLLKDRVKRRREIFTFYERALNGIERSFLPEPKSTFSNRWLTVMLCAKEKVEQVRAALSAEGIESRQAWKPMHLQPVFNHCPAYLNGVSESLFNTGICLPSGSAMTDDQLRHVCTIVAKS